MPLPPVVQQPVLNRDEIVVQLKNGLRAPDWPGRLERTGGEVELPLSIGTETEL